MEMEARLIAIAAGIVVLRDDDRIGRALALEELCCESMTEGAVLVGEHRVGRLAHDGVAEAIALAIRDEEFRGREPRERVIDERWVAADERVDGARRHCFA